ncbi:hypothetical protein VMCG_02652 [Cytospora schulzeri]|uniref:JmjC domain-containing protein n=1 Tax=Cytospora schulzeri TaxID=448051 RepID=A0A423X129_9PEZI|nr:hypothetical protein VMCG_02652 [Valsa malicola]
MAGAGAVTDATVADAATRLRAHCLSAAAGIRDECDCIFRPQQQVSVDGDEGGKGNPPGEGRGGGGEGGKGACNNDADCGAPDIAGCGEPLVQLLSRQATRLLALYEASSSPSWPSPVGPEQPAEEAKKKKKKKKQEPGAAVRPCQEVDHDDGIGRGGGRGGGGSGGDDDDDDGGLLILRRLDDLISVAYSRFYAYLYKDLPLCWRQLYTDASILKFSYLFLSPPRRQRQPPPQPDGDGSDAAGLPATGSLSRDVGTLPDAQLDEMVKTLDLALILAGAGGHSRGRRWIDAAFVLLESVWAAAASSANDNNNHYHGGCGNFPPKPTAPPAAAVIAPTATSSTLPPAKKPRLETPTAARTEMWQPLPPSFSAHEPFTPPVRHPIRRVPADRMDMAAFQRHLDSADPQRGPEPLVLTGLVDDWPARTDKPWGKPSYLLSRTFGGRRLVPVEVGRSYVDEGWGQEIVTFGEFLRKYIDPSTPTSLSSSSSSSISSTNTKEAPNGEPPPVGHGDSQDKPPIAYLAQHQLFLQLTQLRHDILIPDHCYTASPSHPTDPSQDQPELEGPLLNAWFGPPGTITPLHTDPYHNILAQVVGRKYVRLYAPHQTGRMRARGREGGVEMGNTSLLDVGVVEGWDVDPALGGPEDGDGGEDEGRGEDDEEAGERREDMMEEFRDVPFVDCILEPGDALYIPIGWWHYVRGLSVSFSVSLWWN